MSFINTYSVFGEKNYLFIDVFHKKVAMEALLKDNGIKIQLWTKLYWGSLTLLCPML